MLYCFVLKVRAAVSTPMNALKRKLVLFIFKKSKVSSTDLRDKLQFVNSMKRLVFDSRKIPFLKRLISISRLIVEVLNDQKLFTESDLAKV